MEAPPPRQTRSRHRRQRPMRGGFAVELGVHLTDRFPHALPCVCDLYSARSAQPLELCLPAARGLVSMCPATLSAAPAQPLNMLTLPHHTPASTPQHPGLLCMCVSPLTPLNAMTTYPLPNPFPCLLHATCSPVWAPSTTPQHLFFDFGGAAWFVTAPQGRSLSLSRSLPYTYFSLRRCPSPLPDNRFFSSNQPPLRPC